MKDLVLILIVLAMFVFGYFVMVKVDFFIEENQRLIKNENRNGKSKVRIAAENPMLLDSVASALECCSNAETHIAFFLSSGKKTRLLEKLRSDQIDIVLVVEDCTQQLGKEYAFLRIPYEKTEASISCLGLPVEDLDEGSWIQVIWNKKTKSKDRDRVIYALENEHCRLKCSYADYMD